MSKKLEFEGFEGHIELKTPTYMERTKYIMDCQDFLVDDSLKEGSKHFEIMKLSMAYFEQSVVSFELKHLKSGKEFKSIQELEMFKEFKGVLENCIEFLRDGESLGNE